ncbi:MAG: GerMN domain-containing protein [Candidatus Krumholzibacteriia bacterium]
MSGERPQPPRHRPSVRRAGAAGRRPSTGLLALLLIVLVLAAGWWAWQSGQDETDVPDAELFDAALPDAAARAGDRAVMVVFPEWDASGYVTEQRQIPSRDRPGEDLLGVIGALCAGPRISGAVSALPGGTRALGAFLDPDDQSVVLDFSRELVTGHPGGSAAESATLTSILRTVALNYPATRSCVILVEGAQVETLAGHLDLARPFDPRRWL